MYLCIIPDVNKHESLRAILCVMCSECNHITTPAVIREVNCMLLSPMILVFILHFQKHCSKKVLELKYTSYLTLLFVYYTETIFPTNPVISGGGYRLPWYLWSYHPPSAAFFSVEEEIKASWNSISPICHYHSSVWGGRTTANFLICDTKQ